MADWTPCPTCGFESVDLRDLEIRRLRAQVESDKLRRIADYEPIFQALREDIARLQAELAAAYANLDFIRTEASEFSRQRQIEAAELHRKIRDLEERKTHPCAGTCGESFAFICDLCRYQD